MAEIGAAYRAAPIPVGDVLQPFFCAQAQLLSQPHLRWQAQLGPHVHAET